MFGLKTGMKKFTFFKPLTTPSLGAGGKLYSQWSREKLEEKHSPNLYAVIGEKKNQKLEKNSINPKILGRNILRFQPNSGPSLEIDARIIKDNYCPIFLSKNRSPNKVKL